QPFRLPALQPSRLSCWHASRTAVIDSEEQRMARLSVGNHLSLFSNTAVPRPVRFAVIAAASIGAWVFAAPAARYTVVAQTSAAPAVRVLRDFRMNHRVWPSDLNRDGITDLVSTSPTGFANGGGFVQVSTGMGDGTFNAPVQSSHQGLVAGAADFNGDGNPDVIASVPAPNNQRSIAILPGNGTTALGAPRMVAPAFEAQWALSADLNGDGKRDLVVEGPGGVAVYPGNGDFTFGTPAMLTDERGPVEAIIADFNGDGKRDLAIANVVNSVSIFINQGALLFSAADITFREQ